MSTPYALRYTLIDGDTDACVLKWINMKSPGHLVVKHDADEDVNRVHWHALLWSDKKEQALRVDFKKANPSVRGNKVYSLTEIKKKSQDDPVEAYERYMCHGNFDGDLVHVVSAFGTKYTEQWFKEQNSAYYANQKEFKKREAKNAQTNNVVNDLLKLVEEAGLRTREDIALKFIQMFKRERRPINTYYARNVVNTVWATVVGKEADIELAREIAGKL